MQDQLATAQEIVNLTPVSIDIDGTPVGITDEISGLETSIADFFSWVKGVFYLDLGPFTPLARVAIYGVSITFIVITITYVIPVIGFLVGIIRKIYTAITDLIPL